MIEDLFDIKPDPKDDQFQLGYNAARYGEKRKWCEDRGVDYVAGWDKYWDDTGLFE